MLNHVDRDRDLRRPDDTLRIRFAVRGVATDIAVINLDRPRTNSPRSTTRVEPDDDDRATGHRCESDHRSVGSTTREGIRRTDPDGPRHTHPTRRCPPLGANSRPLATRATRSTGQRAAVPDAAADRDQPRPTGRNLQCANCGPSPRRPTSAIAASLPSAGFSRRRTSTTFPTTIAPCVLGGGEDEAPWRCATGMSQEIGGRSDCLGPGDDVSGLQAATAGSVERGGDGAGHRVLCRTRRCCDRIRSTTPAAASRSLTLPNVG